MPIQAISANSIGAGVRISGVVDTDYVLLAGITVLSTDGTAFLSTIQHRITVDGAIFGFNFGVSVGAASFETTIVVGAAGVISANTFGILANGFVSITNAGRITGLFGDAIGTSGSNAVIISNTGIIEGLGKDFGDGIVLANQDEGAVLLNSGTVRAADVFFGGSAFAYAGAIVGADRVFNSGTIEGVILLRGGSDFYDGREGLHYGGGAGGRSLVDGGTGNDTMLGGDSREQMDGAEGNDVLRGGGGGDRLNGGDNDDDLDGQGGTDQLDGGLGNDTLYFDVDDLNYGSVTGGAGYDSGYNTDGTTPITINLTTQQLEAYFGSAADEFIVAGSLGGFGAFVRAGAGNDLFNGSAQADNVEGGAGIDVLYGRGDADDLAGSLGGDWLQGGAGADTFRYNSLLDSTVNGQDFIADFSTADGDKINLTNALSLVPAATFNTGFGTGTSVYVFAGGGGTSLVQVYTGATLQMQIVVSQATLAASDFVL